MRLRIATNKRAETVSTNKRQGSKTETITSQKKSVSPKINPNNSLNTSKRENISKNTPLPRLLTKNLKEITPIKNIMKSRKTRQAIKRGTITILHLLPPKPEPNSNPNPNPKTTTHTDKLAELLPPQEMPQFTTLMLRWHRIWSSRLSLPLNSTEITTLHFLVAETMTTK